MHNQVFCAILRPKGNVGKPVSLPINLITNITDLIKLEKVKFPCQCKSEFSAKVQEI